MLTTQESQGELSDSTNAKIILKKQHSRGARFNTFQETTLKESQQDAKDNPLENKQEISLNNNDSQVTQNSTQNVHKSVISESIKQLEGYYSNKDIKKSISKKSNQNGETLVSELIRKKRILRLSEEVDDITEEITQINEEKKKKETVSDIVLEIEGMNGIKKKSKRKEQKEGEGEINIEIKDSDKIEMKKTKKKGRTIVKKAKEYQSSVKIEEEDDNRNDQEKQPSTNQNKNKKKVDFIEDLKDNQDKGDKSGVNQIKKRSQRDKKNSKITGNIKENRRKKYEQSNSVSINIEEEQQHDPEGDDKNTTNEFVTPWSFMKFFKDKNINVKQKLLFIFINILIFTDIGCSIALFADFLSSDCFGYENEVHFTDYINIILSVLIKFSSLNIIRMEITNNLPVNRYFPFLVPTAIMGVVPNLQLNQFVYSYSTCKSLNPIIDFSMARVVTQILCYSICSFVLLICVLLLACSFYISKKTWKRIKNIGFYILAGLFLLSFVFMFVFTSVIQLGNESIPGLIADNIVFWTFFLISLSCSIAKLCFHREPFLFSQEQVKQQDNNNNKEVQENVVKVESDQKHSNNMISLPDYEDSMNRQDTQGPLVQENSFNNTNNTNSNYLKSRLKKKLQFTQSNTNSQIPAFNPLNNSASSNDFDVSKNLSQHTNLSPSNHSPNNFRLLSQSSGKQRRILLNLDSLKTGEDDYDHDNNNTHSDGSQVIIQDQNADVNTMISFTQPNKKSIFSQKRITLPSNIQLDGHETKSSTEDIEESKQQHKSNVTLKRNRSNHSAFTYDSTGGRRSDTFMNINNNNNNNDEQQQQQQGVITQPNFNELQTSTVNISSSFIAVNDNQKRDLELSNLNVNHHNKQHNIHHSISVNEKDSVINNDDNYVYHEKARSLNKIEDTELEQHYGKNSQDNSSNDKDN